MKQVPKKEGEQGPFLWQTFNEISSLNAPDMLPLLNRKPNGKKNKNSISRSLSPSNNQANKKCKQWEQSNKQIDNRIRRECQVLQIYTLSLV